MAFRQPTFHAPQRAYISPEQTRSEIEASSPPQPQHQHHHQNHHHHHHLADSQEWILFSPSAASTSDRGYTTSSAQTQTAGHSRVSDLGSLESAARSYGYDEASENEGAIEEEEEEDGELDSLDSHLQEFRAEPSVYGQSGQSSGAVLPTHDGLGSFRLDRTMMGDHVQEHLYAFETFNPRKIKRRRESLELGQLELENERAADAERTRRIEQWRFDQSRLLVDEIQRETRRRKLSMSTADRRSVVVDREQEDLATLSHAEEDTEDEETDTEGRGLWHRITKKVIQDLMGIDDHLLSIIFGERLPEDDDLSTTPPAPSPSDAARDAIATAEYDKSCWEYRLLERIAKELGLLVNQLSDHPGAFSTYLETQQVLLPYAGLPVIPETRRERLTEAQISASILASTMEPQFQPTIQTTADPVPIPVATSSVALVEDIDATPRATNSLSQPMTQDEWERELDIKIVFRYLRSRFTSKFKASPTSTTPQLPDLSTRGTSHLATASTADSAARAARVRQHHPLVRQWPTSERRKSIERRTWRATVPGGSASQVAIHNIRRGSSSCASERMSITGRAKRNSGSSTRHYWDFGAPSVGSGSLVASTGAMGSWGEV